MHVFPGESMLPREDKSDYQILESRKIYACIQGNIPVFGVTVLHLGFKGKKPRSIWGKFLH